MPQTIFGAQPQHVHEGKHEKMRPATGACLRFSWFKKLTRSARKRTFARRRKIVVVGGVHTWHCGRSVLSDNCGALIAVEL
jgi:hypothetical protein